MYLVKKPLSILLLLVLLCTGLIFPAYAEEEEEAIITPFFSQIFIAEAGIDNPGGGKLSLYASVSTQSGKADSTSLSMTLQRMNGGVWGTVTSWSKTGGTSTDWSKSYSTTTGYLYRMKVVATATKGSTSESTTIYTSEVVCK